VSEGATVLIAGGGIGGLAAGLAASRSGWNVQLFERTPAFSEVGAGIQLGPNAVRVLQGWGLAGALNAMAAFPERLQVRSAASGGLLAELRLGSTIAARYGAPYLTVHRADLHALLLHALQQRDGAQMQPGSPVLGFRQEASAVTVCMEDGFELTGEVLVGADGLWSAVREQMLGDGPPRPVGHLAYRALVLQHSLPAALQSHDVTVWLAPRMHVVQYPVRGGDWLNVVAIVHGEAADGTQSWDHAAHAADLATAMDRACLPLRQLVEAVPQWRLWVLHDRAPMQGAHEHALGRVALLGDAAHPMRPYLAQGAAMALEDAAELGGALALACQPGPSVEGLLQRYAAKRWQRNARVQSRALRNGQVFHADGLLRAGRDASLRLLGDRLLDLPWLYGAVPAKV
jgi:salicylate hydroxylase